MDSSSTPCERQDAYVAMGADEGNGGKMLYFPSRIIFSMKKQTQAESKLRKGSVGDLRKEKI